MKLGIALPLIDIEGDPATVRDFAQAAEALGYDHLGAPDHVLGVNVATRPDWGQRNTSKDFFHDPFVLFGFLSACTTTIGFSTQVMILPQRQTALVAKQAASLDVLSGGRFRFGIGVGWNPVEYVGFERKLPQSRQALRGAGGTYAEAMGRTARHLQGPMAHDRGRRHQSIADASQDTHLVWRSRGGNAAADRQVGGRLDHARASLRTRRQCRIRQVASVT